MDPGNTCQDPACSQYAEAAAEGHAHTYLLFAQLRESVVTTLADLTSEGDDRAPYPHFAHCDQYQEWWNHVGGSGQNPRYYLEKWHPMARKCWEPKSYMMRITKRGERIDLLATHDDFVDIYRGLKADKGQDPQYENTLRVFYHLCAVTLDPLHALRHKAQIVADFNALNQPDYARIVGALGKYSSRYDTYVHYVAIQDEIIAFVGERIAALKKMLKALRTLLG